MASVYPEQPVEPTYEAPPPKKKMSPWLIVLIIVLALIVLCCICVFGSLILAGPQVGNVFSQIIETMEVMTPAP